MSPAPSRPRSSWNNRQDEQQAAPEETYSEPADYNDLYDEEPEEFYDEESEGYYDEEDEEQFGGSRSFQKRANAIMKAGTQNVLKVGALKVVAPAGQRGLVLPVAENVYLVSHWPEATVKKHGVPTLGRVMVQVAAARLAASSSVGDSQVGLLPLAILLLKNRGHIFPQAAPATPAAPAVVGGACACKRR